MLGDLVVTPSEYVAGELTRHYMKGKAKLNGFMNTSKMRFVERYVLWAHSCDKSIFYEENMFFLVKSDTLTSFSFLCDSVIKSLICG